MNHVPLYNQLVWNVLCEGVGSTAEGSAIVEGVMRGFVKDGRVVLKFGEARRAELAARHLGVAYTATNDPGWLSVDPDVDEATFRELFDEAIGAEAAASLMAEFSRAIAAEISGLPELGNRDWDTFAMVVEVSDDDCAVAAYRYAESGPPVSTAAPEDLDLFRALRDRLRDIQGEAWDVVLVKVHRAPANLVLSFASGPSADGWRVTPANLDQLTERIRPTREDFPGIYR